MIGRFRLLAWSGVALAPLCALALFLGGILDDPSWAAPVFHFYVVSFTCLLAIGLALLMLVAGQQLRDVRVFFMALAFLGIAGLFLTHALTTPGVLARGDNPWVGFSARLSLLAGAIFFALGTRRWSPTSQAWVNRHQTAIVLATFLALIVFGAVALRSSLNNVAADNPTSPESGYSYSEAPETGAAAVAPRSPDDLAGAIILALESPGLGNALGAATLGLLLVVCVRQARLYRLAPSPTLAGFLVSAIFLFQAQLSMSIAPTWHASWWEYHGLMLAGFGVALLGLVLEYGRGGSLAGVVEGLLIRDTIRQLERGYDEVIVALVEAVEAKDAYTRGHTQRVAVWATRVGEELGLSPERLRVLHRSAMLHDLGKIAVPDSILNKPGRLTPEEVSIIQDHPVRGYLIVRNVRSLRLEIGGIRSHHERLDGSGYPDGLVGEAIPLEARVIAVADVFDALTSARAYRSAGTVEWALEVIEQEAGSKLDPVCVAALGRVVARHRLDVGGAEPAVSANALTG